MTKTKKRHHGKPDPFQYLKVDAAPAPETEVQDALRDFILVFVQRTKQDRAAKFLLDPVKRRQGLSALFGWLDRRKTQELEGATGFPQNIQATIGGVPGLFVDHDRRLHLTAPEAAVLGLDCALFISDDRAIALVFAEVGSPTLCIARR